MSFEGATGVNFARLNFTNNKQDCDIYYGDQSLLSFLPRAAFVFFEAFLDCFLDVLDAAFPFFDALGGMVVRSQQCKMLKILLKNY
jgi:hypothetical protein